MLPDIAPSWRLSSEHNKISKLSQKTIKTTQTINKQITGVKGDNNFVFNLFSLVPNLFRNIYTAGLLIYIIYNIELDPKTSSFYIYVSKWKISIISYPLFVLRLSLFPDVGGFSLKLFLQNSKLSKLNFLTPSLLPAL